MTTYIVRTHAGRDFDNWYNNASVVNSCISFNGKVEVVEVEIEDWYTSAYEAALDTDSAVISYKKVEVEIEDWDT